MSPKNMLDLQKLVLENVKENKLLFSKELRKSFQWLGHDDLLSLYNWAIRNFNEQYRNIIICVYQDFNFKTAYTASI